MRFRQRPRRDLIELNLPDQIATRRWVIYGPSGEGAFAENYREQVEAYVRTLTEQHPTIQMLMRGESLSDTATERRVHLTFADTSSRKLTIELSTAKRKELGNTLDIPLRSR